MVKKKCFMVQKEIFYGKKNILWYKKKCFMVKRNVAADDILQCIHKKRY